jgi:uncharacterized protein YkwD
MQKKTNIAHPIASSIAVIALLLLLAACSQSPQITGTDPGTNKTPTTVSSGHPTPLVSNHKTPVARKPKPTPRSVTPTPTLPSQPTTVVPTIPPQPTVAPTIPYIPPAPTPTTPPVSGGGGNGGGTATQQAAQAVFAQINQERASMGLPPFQWSNQLVQSAHTHNLTMQQANQLSHQLPSEPDFGTRITNAGVHWSMAAENIGVGGGDPTSAATGLNQLMFDEKPPNDGHRVNILSSNTMIGIDVLVDTQHNKVWLTEDFAKPF